MLVQVIRNTIRLKNRLSWIDSEWDKSPFVRLDWGAMPISLKKKSDDEWFSDVSGGQWSRERLLCNSESQNDAENGLVTQLLKSCVQLRAHMRIGELKCVRLFCWSMTSTATSLQRNACNFFFWRGKCLHNLNMVWVTSDNRVVMITDSLGNLQSSLSHPR